MRIILASLLVILAFAAAIAACSQCKCRHNADAAANDGNADVDNADVGPTDVDPTDVGSAPEAGLLASCGAGATCGAGSTCITGCPTSGPELGVCSVPGRDTCGCGGVLDPCETPGMICL